MFVYVIVNSATLKIYVGQHKGNNLRKYLQTKFSNAKRNSGTRSHLFASMKKYPREVWSIHSLVSGIEDKKELDETEQLLIYALKAQHPDIGYNICDGGEGFTGTFTEESKLKMSRAHFGHPVTAETKAKISAHTGYKPPEFGETIRQALTGRQWTPEQREKIPQGIKLAIREGRMKLHQWTTEEQRRRALAAGAAATKRHLENFLKTVAWG